MNKLKNKTYLTIHDASTGKVLFSNTNLANSGWNFSSLFLSSPQLKWNDESFKKDLYYQDMITMYNGDILWIYMPNSLKMNYSGRYLRVPEFHNLVWNANRWKALIIKKTDVDNWSNDNNNTITPIDVTNNLTAILNNKGVNPQLSTYIQPMFIPGSAASNSNEQNRLSVYFPVGTAGLEAIIFEYNPDNATNVFRYISRYNPNSGGYNHSSIYSYGGTTQIDQWTKEYNNAMLLPTRNMFDETIVTIPFVFNSTLKNSKSVNIPIFNVDTLHYNLAHSTTGRAGHGPKTQKFNYGQKIYNTYLGNQWNSTDPTQTTDIIWYPWPGSVGVDNVGQYFNQYTHQLYNRLINVSPYDNTIVYASRPDFRLSNNVVGDIFNGNSIYTDYYASFWIGNSSTGAMSNFIIPNNSDSSISEIISQISSDLVAKIDNSKINNIYQNGFWFDINSIQGSSYEASVNLYFNTTGNYKNQKQINDQVKSSPIGVISWRTGNNVASNFSAVDLTQFKYNGGNIDDKVQVSIQNNSYTNYISSRADLAKWYPRTYQSLTQGANVYSSTSNILNNPNSTNKKIADNFGDKLSLNISDNLVELYSNWQMGNYGTTLPASSLNLNVLTNVDNNKLATPNLNIEMKFTLNNNTTWTNNFISTSDKNKATTLSIPVTIPNLSWQFLSSWSVNTKLSNYTSPSSNNILGNMELNWFGNNSQGNYGNVFNSINNMGYWKGENSNIAFESISTSNFDLTNTSEINKYPLRVVFAINPDPDNLLSDDSSANSWLTKFKNDSRFTKKYPLVGSNGEINFNQILKEYANWKAQNLTYSSNVSNPSLGTLGLGQITIDAYLELNPYWDKLNTNGGMTIYTIDTNTKIIIDGATKIKYVYKDEYNGSRTIYKQNSTNFSYNHQSGFGNQGTISSSWQTIPIASQNLKMPVDPTEVADVLVRDSNTTNNIFTAKYVEGSTNIILEPKADKIDWAKTHLPTYSLMTGTGIIFEYKIKGSSEWQSFSTTNGNLKYNENTGSYTITNSNKDIESIRFKLSPLSSEGNGNIVTRYDDWNSQNVPSTFISDEIKLEVVQINVDYTWFNNATLAFQGDQTWNKFLNDEKNGQEQFIQAINTYETSVKNNINNLPNNNKGIVQIKYSLNENDSDYVDANGIYDQLKLKWEDYNNDSNGGIVALYNDDNINNTYATKIYVKFVLNNEITTGNYEFNEKNKHGNNYIKKTKINFKVNLKSFVDILTTKKTDIVLGNSGNGSISNFTPPTMTSEGFLGGKTFDQIVELLKKFGIGIQYKKNDNSWTDNKSEITSYDPTNPIIRIRFTVSNDYNVKVSTNGSGTIGTGSSDILLPLNVPLLIQWNDSILNDFKTDFVTGNTRNIIINKNKEQELIKEIANFNNKNNNSNSELWNNLNNYLEIKYAIGTINSTNSYYYNSDEFITYLEKLTTTQYDNTINIKLFLKESNNTNNGNVFTLDNDASSNHVLYERDNNNIKVFIIDKYTSLFDQIKIAPSSTSNNISFIYPEELDKIKNGQIEGLKIAYSLNQNINYNDSIGNDINNNWIVTEPTQIPTDATTLKIKVYTNDVDKYIFEGTTIGDIDLTKIPKLVDIDSSWFNEIPLTISDDYLKNIQENDIANWENDIWAKSNAIKADSLLKQYVSIRYTIENNSTQYDAKSLINKLMEMQNDYNNSSTLGVVYLWDGTRGTKINATFVSNSDLIIFSDLNGTTNSNLTGQINTSQIKTYIDLSNWANVLNTNKTSVQLKNGEIGTIESFNPPIINNSLGGFLSGKTFDEISDVFDELGIIFKFNNGSDETWNVKNDVNSYNQNNPILYLGVEYNNQAKPNIVFNFGNTNINIENTTLNKEDNALVILQLQAPVAITVDLEELKKLAFQGDTKNIDNADDIKNQITTIIEEIKKNNSSAITDSNLNLEIRFSLNNIQLESNYNDSLNYTDDGIWYTFEKLNEILLKSKTNYTSNKILAKFYIKDNPKLDGNINKYQLSDSNEQVINEEELSGLNIGFKIYINNIEQTSEQWIIKNLKITGTQENFFISNYNSWIDGIPQGLIVEYNVANNGQDQPNDSDWTQEFDKAKPINTTRDFWIRFKVGEAYVFESASQYDPLYSDPIKLDASGILVSLKMKAEWLNRIALTGNLRDLKINETQAIEEIKNDGQMPQNEIIQIEYTYNGANWLKKEQFIAKLIELNGAKDNNNWIILREDIKARFVLNKTINDVLENKYVLEVNNIIISEDNSNNIEISLITVNNNSTVKGYINLDKFDEFIASNFKVTGTNSSANLIVSNTNAINAKLNPYSSNNDLFSILYKWNSNGNYQNTNKIWTPGQEIQEITKLNGTYENRFFGIQFKVDDSNYELYKNNNKQTNNAYEITTPQIAIQISVEIINPFISTNSQIKIKFLNDNSQPQWYNNEGAFTFTIEKSQTSKENQIYTSLSDFLNSLNPSSYTSEMKEALELVYYVSSTELSDEEYDEATSINEINKYDKSEKKYNVWKTLNDSNNISNLNYHLKVGDYVIIALRIKEKSLTTNTNLNGYVLKDNQHSPTKAIRVSGYKVHTSNIDVDWNSMKLRNIGLAESASYGLDGYAMLDQISLKPSNTSNNSNDYLNVSLKLNYFTEFHEDNSNQVLVSGSGTRLVKREFEGSIINGYYKNLDGQEIKDKNGDTIPILYKDNQNGILADPIKANDIQRSYSLIELTSNVYTLELSNNEQNALYSFFKNQDISITFENKKGLAESNLYDYYVDNKNISKDYTIINEIKFPIENDNLIQYTFNSDEFIEYIKDPNNLSNVYQNANDSSKNPINGQAKLMHMYKVTRTSSDGETKTLTTIEDIQKQIKDDFKELVTLKTTYTPANGVSEIVLSNDLSSIATLSNGDRFRIEIVSSNEEDLIYAQQPSPLIFTISGLYEQDIEESLLQYLRVQQNGEFNGEGSFGIYVDDPNNDNDDNQGLTSLLQGYKFMIRVWNSNKTIKQAWTTDIDSVNNLVNGDKVEWKLVAPSGAPVEQAYYNTVADQQNHDANNNKYGFIQVNKTGNFNTSITANGIGTNPTTDTYPTDSGLLIESLKEKDEQNLYTSITETEFIRLMNGMNFSYIGINGQGNMISDKNVSDVVVNTTSTTRQEFTFEYLIQQGYLKFYSNNIEFNWNQIKDNNGNWLISPGTLSNGDQISIRYQDDTMASYYQWSAPEVSGLKNKSDSMSLLTYVGIGVASLVTLGAFALIYFRSRNRKLKK